MRTPTTLPTKPVISQTTTTAAGRAARQQWHGRRQHGQSGRATPARRTASNAGTAGTSNAGTAGTSNAGTAGTSNAGTAARGNAGTAGTSNGRHGGPSNAVTAGKPPGRAGHAGASAALPRPRAERRRADHGAVPRRWQKAGGPPATSAPASNALKTLRAPPSRVVCPRARAGRRSRTASEPWDSGRQACRRTGDNHQQPTACLRSRRGNRPRGQG